MMQEIRQLKSPYRFPSILTHTPIMNRAHMRNTIIHRSNCHNRSGVYCRQRAGNRHTDNENYNNYNVNIHLKTHVEFYAH